MIGLCEKLLELIPPEVYPKFVGEIPSQSDIGVSLSPNDAEVIYYFLGQSETIQIPYVQCNIRTEKYTTGEEYADKVSKALNGYTDGDNILCVRPDGRVVYLGKNEDKLHEFQLQFKVILKE